MSCIKCGGRHHVMWWREWLDAVQESEKKKQDTVASVFTRLQSYGCFIIHRQSTRTYSVIRTGDTIARSKDVLCRTKLSPIATRSSNILKSLRTHTSEPKRRKRRRGCFMVVSLTNVEKQACLQGTMHTNTQEKKWTEIMHDLQIR